MSIEAPRPRTWWHIHPAGDMRPVLILLVGFVLRAAIIAASPATWGGDTIIRLFDRNDLTKAHQLPMLQILIAAVSKLSMNPLLVRYMVAAIGALAGLAFYWVLVDLFGEKWAFPGALLFVTHPYLLAVSTVPFQEILMLAGLFMAFHFFCRQRWLAASCCLAIACLTRYEAWVACPVLSAAYFWRGRRDLSSAVKAVLLFGWAPLIWILGRHGLTSTGHFVVERQISIWRLQRYAYLGWISVKFTQWPVLVLAGAAVWKLYQQGSRIDWRLSVQIAFVVLFMITILFSAHGVMPDPERYVTSREAQIPMCFLLLLSTLGLHQWPRANLALISLGMVQGIAGAFWYVHIETSRPEVQLPFRVAEYLDRSLLPGERAVILTPGVAESDSRLFLDKARQTGGEEGLARARRELSEMAATPPEYQRVAVYSRLGRERLQASYGGCAEWIAVWHDYPEAAPILAESAPVEVIRYGESSVSILRRRCPAPGRTP